MLKNILQLILRHKIAALVIIVIVIYGSYFAYGKLTDTSGIIKYVLATVEKGTITSSISGSGQVSVSQQVDVKAKVSGDITTVVVKKGQSVQTGSAILLLDSTDAQKTVRDAEINLESAQLAMDKLKKPADKLSVIQAEHALAQAKRDFITLTEPPDALSITQAENALAQAKESKSDAEYDLKKAYEDGFNTVSNAFLDLPDILTGLENIFFDSTLYTSKQNLDWYSEQAMIAPDKALKYRNNVYDAYVASRKTYNTNFENYKATSRSSNPADIETLILETYETAKEVADTVKTSSNFIDFIKDDMEQRGGSAPIAVTTHQNLLDTYTSKANTHVSNLLTIKRTIENSKASITDAERSIVEKTESLAKLNKGATESEVETAKERISEKEESLKKLKADPDPLDIKSQELTLKQRENSLSDAKAKLVDYTVRAPFAGVIAKIDVKKGDSLSIGTAAATLITKQRIAEISLNEVDAAKVQIGQKAILTFDAVPDLSITGQVGEIDSIGTVSQGVVSYIVKITFDTQDDRVKPGMSVSANIITDSKPDVLIIPNSAIKSQNYASFVEIPEAGSVQTDNTTNGVNVILTTLPRRQQIETGISNDESTEVTSGLKEGDSVITNTINSQTSTTGTNTTQKSSSIRIPGMGGGGPPGEFH